MSFTQWLTRSWPNGVVNSELEGDLQLGSHAIGGGDQHRVGILLEIEREEAAEAADLAQHLLVEGLARQHLDAVLGLVGGGDIDAGVCIADRLFGREGCHTLLLYSHRALLRAARLFLLSRRAVGDGRVGRGKVLRQRCSPGGNLFAKNRDSSLAGRDGPSPGGGISRHPNRSDSGTGTSHAREYSSRTIKPNLRQNSGLTGHTPDRSLLRTANVFPALEQDKTGNAQRSHSAPAPPPRNRPRAETAAPNAAYVLPSSTESEADAAPTPQRRSGERISLAASSHPERSPPSRGTRASHRTAPTARARPRIAAERSASFAPDPASRRNARRDCTDRSARRTAAPFSLSAPTSAPPSLSIHPAYTE